MSSEPPPWASVDAAPAPLTRRRVVLLVVVATLFVALVVAILTLRSALDAVVAVDSAGPADSVSVDIPNCVDEYPEWIDTLIETESPRIVQVYGTGPVTSTSYRHPEGFPTVALTWTRVIPTCGTTLVIPDGTGVAFYLDAAESSRTEFEAVSSVLTALGYVMTADEGERELLEVVTDEPVAAETPAPEAPVGPAVDEGEAETTASAYRYFRLPEGARLWMQFDPFDVADPDGAGDLYLGYFPAE
ncbi:hypothetical protein [Pseudolysinimonas sp.]|uniref:hypothetical protein n=1 Tax=Pseudolysinimonas sp. TaxID=2680009 RepID=UPI00286C9CA7|nr:hypothetical protein [Pseudolysinimonas sp.]